MSHDTENMSDTISRDLRRNDQEDKLELKHLQQAVLHLYKKLDEAEEENERLSNRIEELENR